MAETSEQIRTPIEFSLGVIEGVKNNAFFSKLADLDIRLSDLDYSDRSKAEMSKEFIKEFSFLHNRILGNMQGDIKKRAIEIHFTFKRLLPKLEDPKVQGDILKLGWEYAELLKHSGLDELTQEIANINLDVGDKRNG